MPRSPDPKLRQWWRALIHSFDPTRDTIAEFCRRNDVSTGSFYAWRRRLKSTNAVRSDAPSGSSFVPVQIVATRSSTPPVVVHLPGGVRVDVPAGEKSLLLDLVTHVTQPVTEVAP